MKVSVNVRQPRMGMELQMIILLTFLLREVVELYQYLLAISYRTVGEALSSDLTASEGILYTIEVAPLIGILFVFIIAFEHKCTFLLDIVSIVGIISLFLLWCTLSYIQEYFRAEFSVKVILFAPSHPRTLSIGNGSSFC